MIYFQVQSNELQRPIAAPEVTLARVLIGSLEKEILENSKIKVIKSFRSKFTFTVS